MGKKENVVDPEGVSGPELQEKIYTQIRDTIVNGFSQLISVLETT